MIWLLPMGAIKTTRPFPKICKELGVELIDGLGDKIQSSSWFLKQK
jgi:hypothetical protein